MPETVDTQKRSDDYWLSYQSVLNRILAGTLVLPLIRSRIETKNIFYSFLILFFSPYLDLSLFSYDDKWISVMERPKACGDHPIRLDLFRLKNKIFVIHILLMY